MTRLAHLIATAAYAGHTPFAPGTVGSIVGLVVYAGVRALALPGVELGVIVGLTIAGIWAAAGAAARFGSPDPGPVVIDEVVGMLVSLAWLDVGVRGALLGFLLFRIFDIVKPYPVSRFERLDGSLGIMADDVMAGVYANLVLRVLLVLAPGWVA